MTSPRRPLFFFFRFLFYNLSSISFILFANLYTDVTRSEVELEGNDDEIDNDHDGNNKENDDEIEQYDDDMDNIDVEMDAVNINAPLAISDTPSAIDLIETAAPETLAGATATANLSTPLALKDVDQPLMGSSRTSGGFSRGRAYGNIPKNADFRPTALEIPVKGEVFLYLTAQYPRDVKFEVLKGDSELVVMVNVVGSMAPILGTVAHKLSIIQSECVFYVFNSILNWNF